MGIKAPHRSVYHVDILQTTEQHFRRRAVEYHAIETGLIQDDEEDASCEESGDEADGNEGYDGEDSDGVSGTGDDGGEGELVRATTIDYGVALSANTVNALFGSDSEDNETPDLSRNAAKRIRTHILEMSRRRPKDDQECDDPLVPRDSSDVNLMKPGDRREEYESLSSDSDYGQFSDDDYLEPVRRQQDDDELSDDERPPVMDGAFIESQGGILSLN
ncbi:hypothetical protein PInf_015524 [Phytophthora infestans]|nr:hypothetical protein PInf_015524 [Phytophthora infestans]